MKIATAKKKKYSAGINHPRFYRNKIKRSVIALVVKNPALSITQIAKNVKAGRHAVYSLLVDLKLTTEVDRLNFSKLYTNPRVLDTNIKISAVRNALDRKESLTSIAKNLNIARKTLYAWITEYNSKGRISEDYVRGFEHPRSLGADFEKRVLSFVVESPNLSIHALAKSLNHASHGVYNVLLRNNLNFAYQRVSYAQSHAQNMPEVKVQEAYSTTGIFDRVRSVFDSFSPNLSPAPPPVDFAKILFGTTALSSLLFYSLLQISSFGMALAMLALASGMFFFIYSLKYYMTLGLVLSYSQNDKKEVKKDFVSWILGRGKVQTQNNEDLRSVGLNPDMDSVTLREKPFVSVHIALFNEKNVVERIAKAVTNFDYPEYEVILADDSTDETTQRITRFQEQFLFKNEKLKELKGEGWILRSVEVRPNVYLRHLHRTTRSGYKGKALDLALKLTDERAKYISIFDADFVPYPDSLTLFLKYFQSSNENCQMSNGKSAVAAVQGYQWHVLNKSENWITRGVRSEYSGSYVVERSGAEIYGGLKQISGSVYMIKKDVLAEIGWGTSITEDFELTLKLYEKGYKVLYTPYVQAPAECVSTLRRLIRQRMRWAEGHSFNVKKMFKKLMLSPNLTRAEKLEFLYLTPYYLQAFFFLLGTFAWLISETIFRTKLPFWTETWGWSLVLTNMISLPLVNAVGLFMEESEKKDYSGIWSFIALSYIVVPFQAYAAVKGFIEKEEGPWFRTPKTGRITDIFRRSGLARFVQDLIPSSTAPSPYLKLATANNQFNNFSIKRQTSRRWLGKAFLSVMLAISTTIASFAPNIESYAPKSAQAFGSVNENGNKVDTIPDDFLALNTDKTSYKVDETVKISMADINYLGETVCDAQIKLTIISPDGSISNLSTDEKSIKVNKKYCENKTLLTVNPDYEARYQTISIGVHIMKMEATRFGETYTVTDTFEVRNNQDFDVKRTSATRIYPKNVYPMTINIKPNVDYKGEVTDILPINFDVFEGQDNEIKFTRSQINDKQIIRWNVNWKAGQNYTLSYFYDTPDKSPDLYDLGKLQVGNEFTETAFWNLAIDASGSGTNVVTPTTVSASSTDQTFTFTYDPSETFTYGGEVRIKVPNSSGWSTPQGTGGTAGYTTASVTGTGTIADLVVTGDSATEGNWTLTEDDTDTCNTAGTNPVADTGVFVEGTASIRCVNTASTGPDATDSFSFDNSGTVDWSSYTTLGFWMRSTKALTSTNGATFSFDDTAAMSSLLQSYNTGTVSANTWTYFTFTLTATRTAVKAFGLVATGTGFDSSTIYLDEVTIGPGSPSFIANGSDTDIRLRFITLDTAATITVTYGSGGGTSGADVPSTSGSYEFTTQSRVGTANALNSLANISSHPTITVSAPQSTAYSFQRKTWYDGTRYWRSYNDTSDGRIEFEYSSDGSSWTEDTSARIATNTNDFSVWANSSNAYVSYATPSTANSDSILTSNLVGYWKMNEASWNGTASEVVDSSGSAIHGTSAGSATTTTGKFNNGGTFNGSSGYVTMGNTESFASNQAATISTWFNISSFANRNYLVARHSTDFFRQDYAISLANSTTLSFSYDDASVGPFFTDWTVSTISTGTWHHLAAVMLTDGTVTMYLDGVSQGNQSAPHDTYGGTQFDLGRSYEVGDAGPFVYLNGLMDDVRVYNTALTSAQVAILGQPGYDIEVRKASSYPGTGYSWGNPTVGYNGASATDYYQYSTISQDSNSRVWLGASKNTGGTYTFNGQRSTNVNDITVWDTATSLDSSANSNKYGIIVPRTSANAQAVWIDSATIEYKNYTSGAWDGSPSTIATGVTGITNSFSLVADSSGNTHLLYIDSSNHTVYQEYTSSWQTAVTLDSNAGNAYPSISIDTTANDLYAFWIRGDDIFYKKGVSTYASGNWDASATSWQTTGTLTWISSVYSHNAPSFAVWTTGSGTPPIDWDIIAVPEFLWLFFGIAPLLPLLTKLRKSKYAREKDI